MKVERLNNLSENLTPDQLDRLTSLSEYVERQRERFRQAGNRDAAGVCTNVLAWIILIAQDE